MIYSLAVPEVRDLLSAARGILRAQIADQSGLVDELSRGMNR